MSYIWSEDEQGFVIDPDEGKDFSDDDEEETNEYEFVTMPKVLAMCFVIDAWAFYGIWRLVKYVFS